MQGWMVTGLALLAAAAFAVSSAAKHRSATRSAPLDSTLSGFGQWLRSLAGQWLWLLGMAADGVGLTLQVLALHFGSLTVVQSILLTSLLVALLLRGCVGRSELLWGGVLTLSLVGLVLLAGVTSVSAPTSADRYPAFAAAGVGLVLVAGFTIWGRSRGSGRSAAPLIGVAVGALYAGTAALLKGLSDMVAAHGPLAVVGAWQLYALLVFGAFGVLLTQVAFQAGPLSASLPAIATVDPLLSIVIGVLVYDERIARGPLSGAMLCLILALLVLAVVQLTRNRTGDDAAISPHPDARTAQVR